MSSRLPGHTSHAPTSFYESSAKDQKGWPDLRPRKAIARRHTRLLPRMVRSDSTIQINHRDGKDDRPRVLTGPPTKIGEK